MKENSHGRNQTSGLTSLDEMIDRAGVREEVEVLAFKRILAIRLKEEMQAQRLSKATMAQRMGTSRAQLDRVLDPHGSNVTIETVVRAAKTLGRRLTLDLA
jgi:predicted XRE-type DNA-binding protein